MQEGNVFDVVVLFKTIRKLDQNLVSFNVDNYKA